MHDVSSYIISGALVTLFLNKTEVCLDIFIMIKIKQRYLFWTINHEINDITTLRLIRSFDFSLFFSRSVMKERASMRRMMIKRCGSMDTLTVTNDKLDTRSHLSDPNDLNRKSAVVVTYSIDDDNQKDVWDISIFIGRRSINLIGSSLLLLAEVWEK